MKQKHLRTLYIVIFFVTVMSHGILRSIATVQTYWVVYLISALLIILGSLSFLLSYKSFLLNKMRPGFRFKDYFIPIIIFALYTIPFSAGYLLGAGQGKRLSLHSCARYTRTHCTRVCELFIAGKIEYVPTLLFKTKNTTFWCFVFTWNKVLDEVRAGLSYK